MAVNALNLATGYSVGTFLEKAYTTFFSTPLTPKEKEAAYDKIAEDAMTILANYTNLASGTPEEAITRVFDSAAAPPGDMRAIDGNIYRFSRAVQDASVHLPDQETVQATLEQYLKT